MKQVLLWLFLVLGVAGAVQATGVADRPEADRPANVPGAGFSFALIGDLPYGGEQVVRFERLIDEINREPRVRFVVHAGDVKGGGERCDDELIQARFAQFQRFNRAFILTPGDNDWTDCHRVSNGSYYPLERLEFLRRTFFPNPDRSTGRHPIPVTSQARMSGFEPFVENVMFSRGGVVFGTLHVVGSNNDLAPWTGFDPTDSVDSPRHDRIAEFEERRDAAVAWLDVIFAKANTENAKGIFLTMQANPRFDLAVDDPDRKGFQAIIGHLRELTAAFDKPVVLAHGDFHEYLVDKPFNTGEDDGLANLTRVQTFGSPRVNWLKVHVVPNSPSLFVFEQEIIDNQTP